MAKFILSAFADEITPDFDGQLEALQKLGIPLLELRGVDGRSFTQLTDAEVDAVGEKLRRAGVGLSALGTPIGKIAVTDDFEAHKALLGRIMDIGDRLGCKRLRVFSFYRGEGQSVQAYAEAVYRMLGDLLDAADARGSRSATRTRRTSSAIRRRTKRRCSTASGAVCAPCSTAAILPSAASIPRPPTGC